MGLFARLFGTNRAKSPESAKDAPPDFRFAGTRKALVVGIDAYPGGNALRGCVNDSKEWWSTLTKKFDYDTRVLLNERATKENILTRLRWLCEGTKKGDEIAFVYSGHGSRLRDRDGDELEDRLDECICPVDMSWDYALLDDEIAECLEKLHPEAFAWMIFDCCHSGTLTRNDPAGQPAEEPERLSRFLAPPFDIQVRAEGKTLPIHRLGTTLRQERKNVISIAACQDNQTAAETKMGGVYRGAFSYIMLQQINNGTLPTGLIVKETADTLKINYGQDPLLLAAPGLETTAILGGPRP